MRYNPATDRARDIDAIATECKAAILKADACRLIDSAYDEILTFYRWEDDILRLIPEPCAA
jgi:hypothetical protein